MDELHRAAGTGRAVPILVVSPSRRTAHRMEALVRRGASAAWQVALADPAALGEVAPTAPVRCVVLDVGSSGVDLGRLVGQVRAAAPRAPIVAVTGADDRATLALTAGAAVHVGAEWKRPGVLRRAVGGALAQQRWELERDAAEALVAERWSMTRAILDSLDIMAVAVDQEGTIVAANAGWLRAAVADGGPFCGAMPGTSYIALHHAAATGADCDPVAVADGVRGVLSGRWSRFDVDCRFPGSPRWHAVSVRPLLGIGAVVSHADVTERKVRELQVAANALHDPLTGLPNREVVLDRLRRATAGGRRRAESTGVLFVDLDEFKAVNDTHGHEAGDVVLRTVADRLRGAVRPGDTVARLGGDEFVVLCSGVADGSDARDLARRLLDVISLPIDVHGRRVLVRASIGGTMARRGSAVAEDLVNEADGAMYRAKQLGRARLEFAEERKPRRRRPPRAHRGLDEQLRHGLETGEVSLAYQPIVALSTGRIMAAEALLRWRRADGVNVEPGEFVPAVEETGTIEPLGRWVLTTACAEMAALTRPNPAVAPLGVSINLSGRELSSATLVDDVAHAVSSTGWRAVDLCLEITETALMHDPDAAARNLDAVRGLGVRVALDDFGTGYSTLLYAKHFRVDIIKIDRAFVDGLGGDGADTVIVQSVLALAHSLGAHVIAEGVETAAHVAALRSLGCESAQGYYFARPLPFEGFEQLCAVERRLWDATHARLVGAAG